MRNAEYKPDCGYAWMVVAACFIINFIHAGLARVAGVLYIALIDTYAVSREVATMPFSLRYCLRSISGPFVGAFGQKFGIRPIVLIGGLVSGVGGIICAFAPNVTWITIAWGGLHGLGYGMSNLIHVVILNRYFEKYKGIALGISLTGDCVGTFLLPILLEFLLPIYGVNGTFLILAGISLNIVPAAMLLKSPPWEDSASLQSELQDMRDTSIDGKFDYDNGVDNRAFYCNMEHNAINWAYKNDDTFERTNPSVPLEINCKLPRSSLPFFSENNELRNIIRQPRMMSIPDICFNGMSRNGSQTNVYSAANEISRMEQTYNLRFRDASDTDRLHNLPVNEMNRRNSQISILSCPSSRNRENSAVEMLCKTVIKDNLLYPVQFFTPHNIENVKKRDEVTNKQFVSEGGNHDTAEETEKISLQTISSNLNGEDNLSINAKYESMAMHECREKTFDENVVKMGEKISTNVPPPNAVHQFIKTNLKPIFLLTSATLAVYIFLFIAVFTIIIDYAIDNGIPSEYGKYLLVGFSVADMIGRIGFGVVLDKKWISLAHYAGLTTALMGFFVFIMPFSISFIFWMISFSLCGFIQGGTAIMYPIIISHYMDKNEEAVAVGCMNFYGGVLMLPIPPMIGYFRDTVGTYDGVFWTTGGLCIFAGCLWLLEPCLIRLQSKNGRSKIDQDLNNR